jgi:ATP-dependent helicase HrpB
VIAQVEVEALFADRISEGAAVTFEPETGSVRASHGRRLGAIQLSGGQDSRAAPAAIEAALLEGVRHHGLALLPWGGEAAALRRRMGFARRIDPNLPDLSEDALRARLDEWLPPLLAGKRRLGDISAAALADALNDLLDWNARQRLEQLAPAAFQTPAGSRHAIDYEAEAGPTVTVRAQALFGLAEHPRIAGGSVPLILALTSPAGRPIQTTGDLPGFWRGSWAAVAKEMRGRYPKHPWPDDPARADPTLRTKKAAGRS